MAVKLFLRPPHSLPLFSFAIFPRPPSSLPKFPLLSFSSLSTSNITAAVPYGPSLRKGTFPTLHEPDSGTFQSQPSEPDDHPLDKDRFTRVFNLAALRVPASYCFALESRLRGHLLNWPRVRNIARVPGDDVSDELSELVGKSGDDEEAMVELNRRIYGKAVGDGEELSPVLWREDMARRFESRGFVNFRNLARMTRAKKRKKRNEEESGGRRRGRIGRSEFVAVEVVGDEDEEGVEDLRGLLGDEFKGRKWRGPTRLLLLDERCSTKCLEELPEAIKVFARELISNLFSCDCLLNLLLFGNSNSEFLTSVDET